MGFRWLHGSYLYHYSQQRNKYWNLGFRGMYRSYLCYYWQ